MNLPILAISLFMLAAIFRFTRLKRLAIWLLLVLGLCLVAAMAGELAHPDRVGTAEVRTDIHLISFEMVPMAMALLSFWRFERFFFWLAWMLHLYWLWIFIVLTFFWHW